MARRVASPLDSVPFTYPALESDSGPGYIFSTPQKWSPPTGSRVRLVAVQSSSMTVQSNPIADKLQLVLEIDSTIAAIWIFSVFSRYRKITNPHAVTGADLSPTLAIRYMILGIGNQIDIEDNAALYWRNSVPTSNWSVTSFQVFYRTLIQG